jgi:hypothetical protein
MKSQTLKPAGRSPSRRRLCDTVGWATIIHTHVILTEFVNPSMILDILFRKHNEILKYQHIIRLLLVLTPLPLLNVKKSGRTIFTEESPHRHLMGRRDVELSDMGDLFHEGRFVLNGLPPRASILIHTKQKESCREVVGTIKKMDFKNVNVIVDLNEPDRTKPYLFEIHLSFGERTSSKVHPLRCYLPNSELLNLSHLYFPYEAAFSIRDFLFSGTPLNLLEIRLRDIPEDKMVFMEFLKVTSFLRSHPYGSYYYIPFEKHSIEFAAFAPIIVPIFLFFVLDWFCKRYPVSVARLVVASLLYRLCPAASLFFLRRNEIHCLLPIFLIFNFKFGLFYLFICYLICVCDVACSLGVWYKSGRLSCR